MEAMMSNKKNSPVLHMSSLGTHEEGGQRPLWSHEKTTGEVESPGWDQVCIRIGEEAH